MYKYGCQVEYVEELLSEVHNDYLSKFDCENHSINTHIRNFKSYNKSERFWGIFDTKLDKLICVYSLKASAITRESNITDGAAYDSAMEISIFAVDKEYQDLHMSDNKDEGCLSNVILYYIISKIIYFQRQFCAIKYIMLYAVPEAIDFYEKCRFIKFSQFMKNRDFFIKGCTPMFLPIA